MAIAIWLMAGALFGLACGLLAIRKNRTASGWFMLGLITGPVALAVVLTRPYRDTPSFL